MAAERDGDEAGAVHPEAAGEEAEALAFSQGALQAFRERLIANDMDRRLLERTIELARATSEFDWKKLPKTLRVAIR